MSFGFSIGDLIAAGTLAYSLYTRCLAAPIEYKELGELCHNIHIVVNSCRPNDPHTVLKNQDTECLSYLAKSLQKTLDQLEVLLIKYGTMGALQGIGNRFGFVGSKEERESIRRKLSEHLAVINTFLSGMTMSSITMLASLLMPFVKDKIALSAEQTVEAIVRDPTQVEDLLVDFSQVTEIPHAALAVSREAISEHLQETVLRKDGITSTEEMTFAGLLSTTAGESRTGGLSISASCGSDQGLPSVAKETPVLPAKPKVAMYDPWELDWFAGGGWRYFKAISADTRPESEVFEPQVPEWRYSEEDEWLSKFPEGWSATQTLVDRNGQKCEGIFYLFNNLSCSPNNKPKTTRAYCKVYPFWSDEDREKDPPGSSRFYHNGTDDPENEETDRLYSMVHMGLFRRSGDSVLCLGFVALDDGTPYDLSDPLSAELASVQYGANGTQYHHSGKTIDQSLPRHWIWEPDPSGGTKHTYTDTMSELESTVHPAHFWHHEDTKSPTLPPGWDRRLDSWGNLFFVDHNTKEATREDPRFNVKIDPETGLPRGWQVIVDYAGRNFYFQKMNKYVVGTYSAGTINSKSLTGKQLYLRQPNDGEDPGTLIRKAGRGAPRTKLNILPSPTAVPAMTGAEKDAYYALFNQIAQTHRSHVTRDEALAQCRAFALAQDTIEKILQKHDTNQDGHWNVDECSNVLHEIKARIDRAAGGNTWLRPMSDEEKHRYYALFETSKRAGDPVMIREEVVTACKDLGLRADLPTDFVSVIITDADKNGDQRWNVDEFAEGMHRIMQEVERNEALKTMSPQ